MKTWSEKIEVKPGQTLFGKRRAYQRKVAYAEFDRAKARLAAAKNLAPQPPLVRQTADKYSVRAYVADTIGEEYLIPLIQVVSHSDDLDMAALADYADVIRAAGVGFAATGER